MKKRLTKNGGIYKENLKMKHLFLKQKTAYLMIFLLLALFG